MMIINALVVVKEFRICHWVIAMESILRASSEIQTGNDKRTIIIPIL